MMYYLGITIIILFFLFAIVACVVIYNTKLEIQQYINGGLPENEKKNLIGNWNAGTFYVKPSFFFTVHLKIDPNHRLAYTIKQHNQWIQYFWYNSITLITGVLVLNVFD